MSPSPHVDWVSTKDNPDRALGARLHRWLRYSLGSDGSSNASCRVWNTSKRVS